MHVSYFRVRVGDTVGIVYRKHSIGCETPATWKVSCRVMVRVKFVVMSFALRCGRSKKVFLASDITSLTVALTCSLRYFQRLVRADAPSTQTQSCRVIDFNSTLRIIQLKNLPVAMKPITSRTAHPDGIDGTTDPG